MITIETTTERKNYVKLMNDDRTIYQIVITRPNGMTTYLCRSVFDEIDSDTYKTHGSRPETRTATIYRTSHYCPIKGRLFGPCECDRCMREKGLLGERPTAFRHATGKKQTTPPNPNPTEYLSSDETPAFFQHEARLELQQGEW